AGVLLVTGSRTWLQGSVSDAVLGASMVHGTGSQVAPGVLAAALVGAASAVAAATAGRVVRVVASVAALLAGLLALVVIGIVVADPGAALGRLAATSTGRTGSVPAHGTLTVWVWVAGVAALAVTLGGLAALAGGRQWAGLSSRYDAPSPSADGVPAETTDVGSADAGREVGSEVGTAPGSAGAGGPGAGATPAPRPQREVSTWERISRGEDPTEE
ncbi:MAG: Trp biosynthesis-associated membrane protein, partial [Oryzihumus sp.]